jgi:hypothetical protein
MVVVVDIDMGTAEIPEGLPSFPDRQQLIVEIYKHIAAYNQHGAQPDLVTANNENDGFGSINYGEKLRSGQQTPVRRAYAQAAPPTNARPIEREREHDHDGWKRISRSFDDEGFMDQLPHHLTTTMAKLNNGNTDMNSIERRRRLQPLDFTQMEALNR